MSGKYDINDIASIIIVAERYNKARYSVRNFVKDFAGSNKEARERIERILDDLDLAKIRVEFDYFGEVKYSYWEWVDENGEIDL